MGVRAFAISLGLAGLYFISANAWWFFEWVPTFAAFEGEEVPSRAESWAAFLPYAAVGVVAVALAAWIFLVTRRPRPRSSETSSVSPA